MDSEGKAVVDSLDSERNYMEGINSTEGHFFDQLGDYVLVDDAGNISKVNRVFVEFYTSDE